MNEPEKPKDKPETLAAPPAGTEVVSQVGVLIVSQSLPINLRETQLSTRVLYTVVPPVTGMEVVSQVGLLAVIPNVVYKVRETQIVVRVLQKNVPANYSCGNISSRTSPGNYLAA